MVSHIIIGKTPKTASNYPSLLINKSTSSTEKVRRLTQQRKKKKKNPLINVAWVTCQQSQIFQSRLFSFSPTTPFFFENFPVILCYSVVLNCSTQNSSIFIFSEKVTSWCWRTIRKRWKWKVPKRNTFSGSSFKPSDISGRVLTSQVSQDGSIILPFSF